MIVSHQLLSLLDSGRARGHDVLKKFFADGKSRKAGRPKALK